VALCQPICGSSTEQHALPCHSRCQSYHSHVLRMQSNDALPWPTPALLAWIQGSSPLCFATLPVNYRSSCQQQPRWHLISLSAQPKPATFEPCIHCTAVSCADNVAIPSAVLRLLPACCLYGLQVSTGPLVKSRLGDIVSASPLPSSRISSPTKPLHQAAILRFYTSLCMLVHSASC
jgi:hypothetical protein